jgi:hypothetical protein
MTFWQQVQVAAGMRGAFVWAMVIFVVAALVLNALRPAERMRIRARYSCLRSRSSAYY